MKKYVPAGVVLFIVLTAFRFFPDDFKLFFRVAEQIPGKTLTVVVHSDSKEDDQLREAIKQRWTVSKYEFITPEEADKMASDTGRVFLFKAWLAGNESPLADYKLYLSKGKRTAKKLTDTQLLENFELFICNAATYKTFDTEAECQKLPYLQLIALNRIHLGLVAGAKSNRDEKTFTDFTMYVFKPKKGIPEEMANKKIYYDATFIPGAEIDWFSSWSKIDRKLFTAVDGKKLADVMLKNEKDVLLLTLDGKAADASTYSLHSQEGKYFFNNSITHR